MNKIYKNLIKSFLLGIVIIWGLLFMFIELFRFNGKDAIFLIIGISIVSTIIYCTYTIKEYCEK